MGKGSALSCFAAQRLSVLSPTTTPRGGIVVVVGTVEVTHSHPIFWPMGDDTAFVPGHGAMSTFGHERRTNPFVSDAALAAA